MKIPYLFTAVILLTLVSCRKAILVDSNSVVNPGAYHSRVIGSSAHELLSDSIYRSLEVEIQYVRGFKPKAGTLDHLRNFLELYLHKPKGIRILLNEVQAPELDALGMEQVAEVENVQRTRYVRDDTTSIYILFTNGVHPGNKILGMAYRNTSAVVYGKAIRKYSSMAGRLTHQELETAVLLHEVGHLLGLVNKGNTARSEHTDSTFHDHCNNRKCLMYHSVETKNLSSILLRGNIPDLDYACIADLVANGGKNVPDYQPFPRPFKP